jgi:hypothetical protein
MSPAPRNASYFGALREASSKRDDNSSYIPSSLKKEEGSGIEGKDKKKQF